MFILDRIDRELLHSLERLELKFGLSSEFFDKIPVRIVLDLLFRVFRFPKASFLPRHLNLVPESHFPFVQISSSYPTTAAKARNWYQRWLWWKGTRILVWKTFHLEKQDFLFICSFALRNFPLERTKKSRSIYFPTGISGNFLSYLTFDC